MLEFEDDSLETEDPKALLQEIRLLNLRMAELLSRGVQAEDEKAEVQTQIARIGELEEAALMSVGVEERRTLNQILKYCQN